MRDERDRWFARRITGETLTLQDLSSLVDEVPYDHQDGVWEMPISLVQDTSEFTSSDLLVFQSIPIYLVAGDAKLFQESLA